MNEWTIGNTCLIIGAGAHVPHGFPTGFELRQQILKISSNYLFLSPDEKMRWSSYRGEFINLSESLLSREDLQDTIEYYFNQLRFSLSNQNTYNNNIKLEELNDAYDKAKNNSLHSDLNKIILSYMLDEFIDKFGRSYLDSIDRYLTITNNIEEVYIGKMLIAYLIHKAETSIPPFQIQGDWIQVIVNKFTNSPEKLKKFLELKPKIITFNYDNLLETILINTLITTHKKTKEQAIKIVEDLGIIHVYGDIKSFSLPKNKVVKNAIDNIKMVNERKETDTTKIKEYLGKVNTLMFLGFGFDEDNMKLLFTENENLLKPNSLILTTNIGLDSLQEQTILSFFPISTFKVSTFKGAKKDCFNLVKFYYGSTDNKNFKEN